MEIQKFFKQFESDLAAFEGRAYRAQFVRDINSYEDAILALDSLGRSMENMVLEVNSAIRKERTSSQQLKETVDALSPVNSQDSGGSSQPGSSKRRSTASSDGDASKRAKM